MANGRKNNYEAAEQLGMLESQILEITEEATEESYGISVDSKELEGSYSSEEDEQQSRRQRSRFINFRFFLFLAVSMLFSILFARVYFSSVIISFALMFVLLSIIFLFACFHKGNKVRQIAAVVAMILSISTYCVYIYEVVNWVPSSFTNGTVYSVSGSVDSNVVRDGNRVIVIDKISFDNVSMQGKLRLYVESEIGTMEFAREGDILIFSAAIQSSQMSVNYRKNQRFYAKVSQSEIRLVHGNPSTLQRIRQNIRAVLKDNLPDEYAELSYSILTGDKNNLPVEMADYFRISGISHILAVSGLHINFMLMLLMLPLERMRIKKSLFFVILLLAMLGYTIIADFSPSVVRAVIMGTIGIAVRLTGRERDSLNNLCCAACLILAAKPHFVYDIGFLLSMMACLGIILFYSPIRRRLVRWRIPRILSSPLSLMISVQIGMQPIAIFFFHTFSIYSILTNLALNYIMMLTFMILFAGVLLSYFLPFMGFIIQIAGVGMRIIDSTALFVSNLPYASLVVYTLLPIFACYLLYFVASRFVRKKFFPKTASLICLIIALSLILSLNYSYDIKNTIIPVSTSFYDVTSIVTIENKTYVIGDVQSSYDLSRNLTAARVRKIEAIFVSNLDEKTARQLLALNSSFRDFTIYFPVTTEDAGYKLLKDRYKLEGISDGERIEDKFYAEFALDGKFLCYRMVDEITVLFLPISVAYSKLPSYLIVSADIIRSFSSVASNHIFLSNEVSYSKNSQTIMMQETKTLIYNYKNARQKLVSLV